MTLNRLRPHLPLAIVAVVLVSSIFLSPLSVPGKDLAGGSQGSRTARRDFTREIILTEGTTRCIPGRLIAQAGEKSTADAVQDTGWRPAARPQPQPAASGSPVDSGWRPAARPQPQPAASGSPVDSGWRPAAQPQPQPAPSGSPANTTVRQQAGNQPPATPGKPAINAAALLQQDLSFKRFLGIDDTRYWGPDPKFAQVMIQKVLSFPGVRFDLPLVDGKPACYCETELQALPTPGVGITAGSAFEQLMIHALAPSEMSKNKFVALTAAHERQVESMVLSSPGNVSPAVFMEMCLKACGGNYALAALTGHNLLKEIAYSGRAAIPLTIAHLKQGRATPFPARFGNFAAKLMNMRTKPGDKMGIWYHSFVPLAITAWAGRADVADKAIRDEYSVRSVEYWARTAGSYLPFLGSYIQMGSPVDPEKKASDKQFAQAAHTIAQRQNKNHRTFNVCELKLVPEQGPPGTTFKLAMTYSPINHPLDDAAGEIKESITLNGPMSQEVYAAQCTRPYRRQIEAKAAPHVPGDYTFDYVLSGNEASKSGSVPFKVTGDSAFLVEGPLELHNKPFNVNLETVQYKSTTSMVQKFQEYRSQYGNWPPRRATTEVVFAPLPSLLTRGQGMELSFGIGTASSIRQKKFNPSDAGGIQVSAWWELRNCYPLEEAIPEGWHRHSSSTFPGESGWSSGTFYDEHLNGQTYRLSIPFKPKPGYRSDVVLHVDDASYERGVDLIWHIKPAPVQP